MKRVLYITEYVDIGGGESSLLNTMYFLKEKKLLEPILLVPKVGEITNMCEELNIKYIVHPLGRYKRAWLKFIPIFNIKAIKGIIRIINEEHIDLIHINSNSHALANSLLPSFICKTKLIWTCHGWWEKPYGLRAKLLNLFVDKIFVVSDYVKQYVDFPDYKVKTTYLGIDIDRFNKKGLNKEVGLQKKEVLGIPETDDSLIIGMIGRYQPVKKQDLFLKAIEDVFLEITPRPCYAVLIGDVNFNGSFKSYKSEIEKSIKDSHYRNRIISIGFEKDLSKYYEIIDILVVPSEFESFSMVTLEGMAYGIKVVATNRGGPSELILDKKNGFLFESNNKNDLVDKILAAINSPNKINLNARERAKLFSIERIASCIFDEYKELWGL